MQDLFHTNELFPMDVLLVQGLGDMLNGGAWGNCVMYWQVVLSLSFQLKWVRTTVVRSQWFLNLLSNQAWANRLVQAWF